MCEHIFMLNFLGEIVIIMVDPAVQAGHRPMSRAKTQWAGTVCAYGCCGNREQIGTERCRSHLAVLCILAQEPQLFGHATPLLPEPNDVLEVARGHECPVSHLHETLREEMV